MINKELKNFMNKHYKSVPDGFDLDSRFETYILAFCPDTASWFATNQRFFFYEYPKEFVDEKSAIDFFKSNLTAFARVYLEIMIPYGGYPCLLKQMYFENTKEIIEIPN